MKLVSRFTLIETLALHADGIFGRFAIMPNAERVMSYTFRPTRSDSRPNVPFSIDVPDELHEYAQAIHAQRSTNAYDTKKCGVYPSYRLDVVIFEPIDFGKRYHYRTKGYTMRLPCGAYSLFNRMIQTEDAINHHTFPYEFRFNGKSNVKGKCIANCCPIFHVSSQPLRPLGRGISALDQLERLSSMDKELATKFYEQEKERSRDVDAKFANFMKKTLRNSILGIHGYQGTLESVTIDSKPDYLMLGMMGLSLGAITVKELKEVDVFGRYTAAIHDWNNLQREQEKTDNA